MSFVTSADGAMRAIFDKIDTDGNGTLDRDEVAACMKLLRPSRFMDIQLAEMDGRDEIAEVMAQMDDDGDGTVTFEEFSAWWKAGGSLTNAEREEKARLRKERYSKTGAIRTVFEELDEDGSGALDRDEVRKAVTKLGKVLTSAQLDDAMYEMDVDCSGSVDFREFLAYVQSGAGELSGAINVAAGLRLEAQDRASSKAAAAELMACYDRVLPTAMKDLFDEVDEDGNGSLDAEEVARFVRKLKPTRFMPAEEVAAVMGEMDTDGDGTVTYDEFAAWWKAGGSVTASEQVAEGAERCGDALAGALEALAESRAARSQALASEEADRISEQVKAIAAAAAASA